ncbi:response regulator [Sediminicola sp. 1XM1-17]|uniref:response regulator n=1 Tax=Sediminicola sp. 1XM1-17 TaxID=3127702 RepID=UPI003077120A
MALKEILLIDDNYIDNYINKRIVTSEKIAEHITVKLSPVEALEYLGSKMDTLPELIFLDIKMPEMDGFEFLKELSKLCPLPHQQAKCNIIMLSSSINRKDIDAAKKNPLVKDFLTKPLDPFKLNAVMKLLV